MCDIKDHFYNVEVYINLYDKGYKSSIMHLASQFISILSVLQK